ncbi:MAG: nicotinate (nicotinamide) nucleotide adenylyltransferase [Clostridia bacterium]|nr:nicotinate (nicotinamide) nucleotide adenylyltransferase [Clostridia bacterium]
MTKTKVGIFGGTFNPVHKGHVAVAESFIRDYGLDVLYVIPNNISPLKYSNSVSGEDRANMLNIAFTNNEKVIISDIELKREGTSYTRDTVAELKELHPESELYLLTGDDWIDSFDKWKDYKFILENARLVVAVRSGNDISLSLDRLESLSGIRPLTLQNEKIELSSSEFRAEPKKELLPNGVFEYIEERGLYGI